VVVRVEASPINPSDLGLLFGGADMSTAKASGTPDRPVVTAEIRPEMLRGMAGRIDQPMPVATKAQAWLLAILPTGSRSKTFYLWRGFCLLGFCTGVAPRRTSRASSASA
jgi:hypothetical protein